MKVLITGGTGLLGYHLQLLAPPQLNITSCYLPSEEPLPYPLPFPAQPLDITDFSRVTNLFTKFSPDIVIHTAAQGSIDWCEDHKPLARSVNIDATFHLIDLCRRHHAHFIFLSTNAVYDGHSSYAKETDVPHPVNFYGASKLAVEQALTSDSVSSTIIRPNLMYGWPYPGGRDNQVTRVINSLRQSSPIKILFDTWFSPVSANFMSRVIWHCALDRISGLFNIGGSQRMTLFDLSKLTAQIFQLDPSLLIPVSIKDVPAAPRAIDTSFSTTKMTSELFFSPQPVAEDLLAMKTTPVQSPA
jgi:dTDP-4-dehydrorhamnose reductase